MAKGKGAGSKTSVPKTTKKTGTSKSPKTHKPGGSSHTSSTGTRKKK
jgi:hypothetical protein